MSPSGYTVGIGVLGADAEFTVTNTWAVECSRPKWPEARAELRKLGRFGADWGSFPAHVT
jgi:hypothetical protein